MAAGSNLCADDIRILWGLCGPPTKFVREKSFGGNAQKIKRQKANIKNREGSQSQFSSALSGRVLEFPFAVATALDRMAFNGSDSSTMSMS
jgi:hypothetical protein